MHYCIQQIYSYLCSDSANELSLQTHVYSSHQVISSKVNLKLISALSLGVCLTKYRRTREIFGGVKYWQIHISLTFGWYNIGELTFASYIWMVKPRHLRTFGG